MFNLFAKAQPEATRTTPTYYPEGDVANEEESNDWLDGGEYAPECYNLF